VALRSRKYPGDTIVYVPEAKTAWTGNFLSDELIGNTVLLEGGPRKYIDTLAHCKKALDVKCIIPGHGPMGGRAAFDKSIAYLWSRLREVDEAIGLGLTRAAAIEAISPDKRSPNNSAGPSRSLPSKSAGNWRSRHRHTSAGAWSRDLVGSNVCSLWLGNQGYVNEDSQ